MESERSINLFKIRKDRLPHYLLNLIFLNFLKLLLNLLELVLNLLKLVLNFHKFVSGINI